jgi:threonine dehydratase
MSRDAPSVKVAATRDYLGDAPGSEIVLYDRDRETREELGARLARERDLEIIPPYDHPDVIAGQGTVALELFEQTRATGNAPLDALFVCVGGGGLLSGCAITARALAPGCRVIGVEPELADDATRSFRTRTLCTVHNPPTIADGARTPSLGRWTFPLVLANVDEMMTVSEREIAGAMRLIWERVKIVCEPTGALALAGLLRKVRESPDELRSKRVGVVVSGGNVDLEALPALLAFSDG